MREMSNQTEYRSILSATRCDRIEPGNVDLQGLDGQEDTCLPVMLFIHSDRVSIGLVLFSHIFFSPQKNYIT